MKRVQVGKFEFYCLMVLYITASDKIRGIYFRLLKQDIFITLCLGLILSFIIMIIYYLVFKHNNYVNFEHITENLLGKHLGKLLLIAYSAYFLFLAVMDLKDITHLNRLYVLDTTPAYIISTIIMITVYSSIMVGIEATSRVSNLLFMALLFVFSFFSILLLTSNKLDFSNFLPFFEINSKKIIVYSIQNSYAIPYGELFVFIIFFKYLKVKKDALKFSLLSQLTLGIIILSVTVWNIIVLGPIAMEYTHTPSLLISKRIDIAKFIQRFDLITVMILLLGSYIKQFVLIYGASYCMKHVFKKFKFRVIATLLSVIVLLTTIFMFNEYIMYLRFRRDFIIPYINSIFEVIIPISLLLLTFIRKPSLKGM